MYQVRLFHVKRFCDDGQEFLEAGTVRFLLDPWSCHRGDRYRFFRHLRQTQA